MLETQNDVFFFKNILDHMSCVCTTDIWENWWCWLAGQVLFRNSTVITLQQQFNCVSLFSPSFWFQWALQPSWMGNRCVPWLSSWTLVGESESDLLGLLATKEEQKDMQFVFYIARRARPPGNCSAGVFRCLTVELLFGLFFKTGCPS